MNKILKKGVLLLIGIVILNFIVAGIVFNKPNTHIPLEINGAIYFDKLNQTGLIIREGAKADLKLEEIKNDGKIASFYANVIYSQNEIKTNVSCCKIETIKTCLENITSNFQYTTLNCNQLFTKDTSVTLVVSNGGITLKSQGYFNNPDTSSIIRFTGEKILFKEWE